MATLLAAPAHAVTISGSATYRERIALPSNAALEVTVEDVSRADAPATVIGRVTWMPAGQVPITFEVPYEESWVQQNHRYSVRARITQEGKLLWTTTQSHPVLTNGAGNRADGMLLQRVVENSQAGHPLTNTYWKLTELNGAAVPAAPKQREPHLLLQPHGNRLTGSGGCNRLMGTYRLTGPSISFDAIASTKMACPEGTEQEAAFVKTLKQVQGWKIDDDRLELNDGTGAVTARFAAVRRELE
jgi:putative lipoprotein